MKETGVSEESAKNSNMARTFGFAFLASLIVSAVLSLLMGGGAGFKSGDFYGFVTGFGLVAMSFAINDLFEQRALKLFSINAGYHIVSFTIMGSIIGGWA